MHKKYLYKSTSPKHGLGVFSHVDIMAGDPIIELKGSFFSRETLPKEDRSSAIQIGHNLFLGASGEIDDWINHSCDPNCALDCLGNRAILRAVFFIPAGMEITFDYSTTSTETQESWKISCSCGSIKCRKIISGLQYLPQELQEEYRQKRMLPAFLAYPGKFK
jgi:SET domain-containing protein